MKVLPFILKTNQGTLARTNLSLFLAHGGKGFWQTEQPSVARDELEKEYLVLNGLIPKQIWMEQEIAYVQIDAEKTNLNDFYTWEEAYKHPQKPECWRSFYFFKDATGAPWFTPSATMVEAEIEGKSIEAYYEVILRLLTN
jgi:hypothetical protein